MWFALTLILGWSCVPSAAAQGDDVPLVTVYVDENGGEVSPETAISYTVPNARCVFVSSCGGVKVDQKGNHFGCLSAGGTCGGYCHNCERGGDAGNQCVFSTGESCHISSGSIILMCGFDAKYRCSNVQGSYPKTPNGCYCDLAYPVSPPGEACRAAECTP